MENMTQMRDDLCYFFTSIMCNFSTQTVFDRTGCQKAWKKIRTGEEGKGKTQVQKREKRKKNEIKTEINPKNDFWEILRSLARVLLFNYNS